MVARKTKSRSVPPHPAARLVESLRRETAAAAELTALPVQHTHAAGIDVGDTSHWVCIDADGGDEGVREFPAHTPKLRELVAWLRQCGVTRVALEASGAYGHVLFLTLTRIFHQTSNPSSRPLPFVGSLLRNNLGLLCRDAPPDPRPSGE